jgi:ribosomal protein L7/L12
METVLINNTLAPKRYEYCEYCNKQYTRKSAFKRHVVLCEVLHQSKRVQQCQEEEETDIPSTKQLYSIIQELAMKCNRMEEKMDIMQKWVDQKKKKINVIEWLMTNRECDIIFTDWVKKIYVDEGDITSLMEKSFVETAINTLKNNIKKSEDESLPIACFAEKTNKLYIYDKCGDTFQWMKLTSDGFASIVRQIHAKYLKQMCEWRDANRSLMDGSDKVGDVYNKAMLKVMGFDFNKENNLSKIRAPLYTWLKVEIKEIFEYEFSFDE